MEQTLGRFVPAVITAHALQRLRIPLDKLSEDLPKIVKAGIDRIHTFQHADGGWGWYCEDPTHPFMTAYALWALSEARRAGCAVDEVRLQRARACLLGLLAKTEDPNLLAYQCFALATNARDPVPEVDALLKKQASLGPYGLALLAMACARLDRPDEARALADRLALQAIREGDQAHWKTENWFYRWEKVDVESTAFSARALLALRPGHEMIPRAANWILAQSREGRWRSTKDTTASVLFLLEYGERFGFGNTLAAKAVEGVGDGKAPPLLEKLAVRFNGGNPQELLIDLNHPAAGRFVCGFDSPQPGTNTVTFDRTSGSAELELDAEIAVRSISPPPSAPQANGIAVRCSFDRAVDALHVGDEVAVELELAAAQELDFVMAHVPIPAGCEVIRGSGTGAFAAFEERYEKASFFLQKLGTAPVKLHFRMRCAFAGSYTAPPPSAAAMYDDSICGWGPAVRVTISE